MNQHDANRAWAVKTEEGFGFEPEPADLDARVLVIQGTSDHAVDVYCTARATLVAVGHANRGPWA